MLRTSSSGVAARAKTGASARRSGRPHVATGLRVAHRGTSSRVARARGCLRAAGSRRGRKRSQARRLGAGGEQHSGSRRPGRRAAPCSKGIVTSAATARALRHERARLRRMTLTTPIRARSSRLKGRRETTALTNQQPLGVRDRPRRGSSFRPAVSRSGSPQPRLPAATTEDTRRDSGDPWAAVAPRRSTIAMRHVTAPPGARVGAVVGAQPQGD